MEDPGLVEPRGIQRHSERSGDVLGLIVVHNFQAMM
jgi:hypothetical protein